ncbi:Endochitinase [Drechslerella dactyloides]|uniref:chitinase n=1 Tax=Drechslerella dactyloides TaxID=74499 RepID=A0AAD6IYY4_DREDA|nr:Endochitinase [Drechslerella dactyloides]
MSPSFKSLAVAATLAASLLVESVAAAGWDPNSRSMTAVYWGQNGGASVDPTKQENLLTTCQNKDIDIVVVSFVTKFKGKSNYPIINLSNQCGGYLPLAEDRKKNTDILNCPDIGTMITECQKVHGKKVLLSLGGATYQDKGWASPADARSSANEIWAMFGYYKGAPFKYRPFGDAVVDGFDLDFEFAANKPNTNIFAQQLRNLYAQDKTGRQYLLTAAPQCPHPDAALDQALTTVPFDAIFIQFYNNDCGVASWDPKKAQTSSLSFNLQMWQTWATTKSANKRIKLFVGLLAGGIKPATGYVSAAQASKILKDSVVRFPNFGGASFWDASILKINSSYLRNVRKTLLENTPKKRDLQSHEIRHPVGGPATYAADDFVEVKTAVEPIRRRRHFHHHRRSSGMMP